MTELETLQKYKLKKEHRCEVCHAKQWERIDETHFRCGNCGTVIEMVYIGRFEPDLKGEPK